MWQALETKARFIAQVITGEQCAAQAEDIGGQELSYAEVKAIASGNPAVLTLAEADAELQRLSFLKKNHVDEQYLARRNVRDLPETIKRLTRRLADLEVDLATVKERRESIRLQSLAAIVRRKRGTALGRTPGCIAATSRGEKSVPLGSLRRTAIWNRPQSAL